MRIKSEHQLNALVKEGQISASMATRLRQHFERNKGSSETSLKVRTPSSSRAPQGRGLHTHKYASSSVNQRMREARVFYYTLPEWDKNPDPEVMLYRACVARWGRAYEGGLCVYELGFQAPTPFDTTKPKRWYIDTAIPQFRIAIECDGYQYHSSLDAVKRDHIKSEFLQRHGWLVFRAGNARIKNDIETFLDSIEHAMRYRVPGDWTSHIFKGSKEKASNRSLLLSWTPRKGKSIEPEHFTLPEKDLNKYV